MTNIEPYSSNLFVDTPTGIELDVTFLAGRVRPATARMYSRDFRAYLDYAGSVELAMEPTTFARWRTHLAQSGKSPNTINRMLSAVRAVIRAAAEVGYVNLQIADAFRAKRGVKISALRDRLKPDARTRISLSQMRAVIELPDTRTLSGKMHRALLLTLATSGLRIGEAVNLKTYQLEYVSDGDNRGYRINDVLGKTDDEPRVAPLGSAAYDAIRQWLEERPLASEYVFTGFQGRGNSRATSRPISQRSGWYIVKRYFTVIGMPSVTPHDLRRYVGTQLAKTDIRLAQKALGHKSIDTTARHYVLDDLPLGLTDNLI